MRKMLVLSLFVTVVFLFPIKSNASYMIGNLNTLTEIAKLVVTGECVSFSAGEMELRGNVRKVIDYEFKVDQIVKNEEGVDVKTGEIFKFKAFAPALLSKDQKYMLFLKRYQPAIWTFVMGGQGVFKIDKDEKAVSNSINNRDLMKGVAKEITGEKAAGAGFKAFTAEEDKTLKHVSGPIELKNILPVIERIEKVRVNRKLKEQTVETGVEKQKVVKDPRSGEEK